MDKEDFLGAAMKLLKIYVDEDRGVAENLLKSQGLDDDEIQDVLNNIENMAKYGA